MATTLLQSDNIQMNFDVMIKSINIRGTKKKRGREQLMGWAGGYHSPITAIDSQRSPTELPH